MGTASTPVWATQTMPSGATQSILVTTQVCTRAAAVAFLEAIAPAVTAKNGPHPGAELCLIQEWGDDQNIAVNGVLPPYAAPFQPTSVAFGWSFTPGVNDRVFDVYTTTQELVFSIVAFGIASENGPGTWEYVPLAGDPSFSTLQWVADPAQPAPVPTQKSSLAVAQSMLAYWQQQVVELTS